MVVEGPALASRGHQSSTVLKPPSTQFVFLARESGYPPRSGPQNCSVSALTMASGANFLFCDGSVKWLKSTTDLRVLSALGTRAGGEVISVNNF